MSAVVQLHPQLHHLDALDEVPTKGRGKARKEGEEERAAAENEARAIDVKIKAAGEDGETAMVAGNLELLKKMQDERWSAYEWVDAEVCFSLSFCHFAMLIIQDRRIMANIRRVHDQSGDRDPPTVTVRC